MRAILGRAAHVRVHVTAGYEWRLPSLVCFLPLARQVFSVLKVATGVKLVVCQASHAYSLLMRVNNLATAVAPLRHIYLHVHYNMYDAIYWLFPGRGRAGLWGRRRRHLVKESVLVRLYWSVGRGRWPFLILREWESIHKETHTVVNVHVCSWPCLSGLPFYFDVS